MWFLLTAALAGTEALCNGVDDDFDGSIDEGAICNAAGLCEQVLGPDGSSFLICDNVATFPRAAADVACASYGYVPAVPQSQTEQDLVVASMGLSTSYWLGLSDQVTEGVWLTPLDQVNAFFLWDTAEPNGGTSENCSYFNWDTVPPHAWHDISCDANGAVSGVACEARCSPVSWWEDVDLDGYGGGPEQIACNEAPVDAALEGGDCDDSNPTINPGVAQDSCNGVDDDCDQQIDEDEPGQDWYLDGDGDGFGGPDTQVLACDPPLDFVAVGGDCNDQDPTAYPNATEICDGDLEDCNGLVDEGLTLTFWRDSDGDGFGDAATSTMACSTPSGFVGDDTDCNDGDSASYPGAPEVCDGTDNNCDHQIDEGVLSTFWLDDDADGFGDADSPTTACSEPPGSADNPDDCDDQRSEAYPGAPELCNNLDDDCDAVIDNGTNDVQWYLDGDGDGFGDAVGAFQCVQPAGQVSLDGDCDDLDPLINPTADEVCDSIDHDCDGQDWNGLLIREFWPDVDQDGYGAGTSVSTCASSQPGHVGNADDCNDQEPAIHPAAEEVCDGIDNDCDTLIDDDDTVPNPSVWYPDADQDDFGDDDNPIEACLQPPNTTDRGGDCDDTEPNVFAGAPEACADGLDNDCDGLIDSEDSDFVNGGVAYAQDADDDNFGDPFTTLLACSGEQPLGWVPLSLGEDCDDGNSGRNPGLDEVCDGVDNDCVGGPDDGLFFLDYFVDADGDGFGDPGPATINACAPIAGRSGNGLDCDDGDAQVHPNAIEVCNGDDDDCDGVADNGLPSDDYYPDLDGDGYGDQNATAENSCDTVSGKVTENTDCDDTDSHIHPGAPEDPDDGIDADCDGTVEEQPPERLPDTDGDGVPDSIDRIEPSGDPTPTAPAVKYGCGCTQGGSSTPGSSWWRRR